MPGVLATGPGGDDEVHLTVDDDRRDPHHRRRVAIAGEPAGAGLCFASEFVSGSGSAISPHVTGIVASMRGAIRARFEPAA